MEIDDSSSLIEELIRKHGLGDAAQEIRDVARLSVRLQATRCAQHDLDPLDSRLGGLPHLPEGFSWPLHGGVPMAHLATIRLSEASRLDPTGLLPQAGMLYFWLSARDDFFDLDRLDTDAFRVDYIPNERIRLELRDRQIGQPSDVHDNDSSEGFTFLPSRVDFKVALTLPDPLWISDFAPHATKIAYNETYCALLREYRTATRPEHRLLGHASPKQEPMERECQKIMGELASRSHNPADRARLVSTRAIDWRLLLQLDTDDDGPGWMWGDCGLLYFWMPEAALPEADFGRAWALMQGF